MTGFHPVGGAPTGHPIAPPLEVGVDTGDPDQGLRALASGDGGCGAEDVGDRTDAVFMGADQSIIDLGHSHERSKSILATARDAFVSIDQYGTVEGWNPAAEQIFGWLAGEAVGQALDQLIIPPAHRPAHRHGLERLAGGEPSRILDRTLTLTAIHRSGREFPIELTIWSIEDNGRVTFNAFMRDISARKAAEASLARLAAVVEQSSDAIITVDPDGVVLSWNKGAELIYGYRADQIIGKNAASVLAPTGDQDDRDRLRDRLERGMATTGRELALVRADGHPITVSVTSSPLLDSDGRLTAVSSISRDISAQRAAERKLAESEARTKTSLDHMLDGFAILRSVRGPDGIIVDFEWTYINPAGAATYGREADAVIGATMRTVVPGVDASGAFTELCQVVDTGEVRSRLQRRSEAGEIRGVFDSVAWKLDDGLALTWKDVTDRERALAAIAANEERFRASVEHLNEALSVFTSIRDESGRIVDFRWEFANSAASAITGYSPSELVGRTLLDVLPHHGPSGMMATYCTLVETGESYADPSLWYEDVWGDGRALRRAFDVRATKLDDGFVVVTREVTDQREHEAALQRQRQELERSNIEMGLLNTLAEMLQGCSTLDDAYSVATQTCAALFPDLSGSVSIMGSSLDLLDVKAHWGYLDGVEASFGPSQCWALRQGRAYISGAAGSRCGHLSGVPSNVRCLCLPMTGQDETIGVFHLATAASPHDDATDDLGEESAGRRLATTVASHLSMTFANLRLRESLREMSIRDPLTGLFNRRYMEETLDRELSRAARTQSELALVFIDVDHFKEFNDTHGHDAGDAVLTAVGQLLTQYSRTSDVACRYGGEEFILILPNCSPEDATLRADALRRQVSSLRVPFADGHLSGPTISCGVAGSPRHATTVEALVRLGDGALYAAKRAGRDQVIVAPFSVTDPPSTQMPEVAGPAVQPSIY